MDQSAENRLATLHASIRKRMHDQDQIFMQLKYHSDEIKNDSSQSFFIFMHALPIALTLGFLFGGLAERGPIAHAQSVDVTDINR